MVCTQTCVLLLSVDVVLESGGKTTNMNEDSIQLKVTSE